MTTAIAIPTAPELAAICQSYGVARLDIYGSVLRDDFDPSRSDVDLLVEFLPGRTPDFFVFDELADRLSELFDGRKVDLVTTRSLNRWIRGDILSQRQNLYVAG
jgi:predicted nucleotidyltransferase